MLTAQVPDGDDLEDDEAVEDMEEMEDAGACAPARHPAGNKISSVAAYAQLSFLVNF
jgi:hypothetical protein